ncbi:MAG: Hsp20/alpha crystallin family protein [Cyanobacteria bacterium P01_A01_bin.68]
MALVRYNPWQEMNSLQRQLNRLFDDALTSDNWGDFSNLSKVPAAELIETDDALHLKLEVPGMSAKDLDIQVMADRVAISGERKSETKSEEDGRTRLSEGVSFRTEFRYGKFQRVIPLPARIQNTNVTADYKDGILNLTLPKSEEEKNKVVKVNLLQDSAE